MVIVPIGCSGLFYPLVSYIRLFALELTLLFPGGSEQRAHPGTTAYVLPRQ